MVKSILFLSGAFALGVVGYASAAGVHRTIAPPVPYLQAGSGVIGSAGKIIAGKYFAVMHPQRGLYLIQYSPGYFGPTGYPACATLAVEGIKRPVRSRVVPECNGSTVSFEVFIQGDSGFGEDRTFQFVAVGLDE
ncbi:MAG TPA: hypothetical protein VFE16_05385 [Candidatus Cybelea sp.]|jgi:hypothetical protein|nr:hypothetical protein [Candidatus Cybelea sp.]